MKRKWVLLTAIILMLSGCGVDNVQEKVKNNYTDEAGRIHAYPNDKNSEYLSESIGLYMEYLVLAEDGKTFLEQYELLRKDFIVHQGDSFFIRWRLGEDINTNALIDDWRIIRALKQATTLFDNKDYAQLADQLSDSLAEQQMDGYTVDFYDWQLGLAADRITLSYLAVDSDLTSQTEHLLLAVDDSKVFFPEYCDVSAEQFMENEEVHMIDQLLIAMNRLDRGEPSPLFEEWITAEWNTSKHIFGRYGRNSFEPQVDYESLAVYYYVHRYITALGEPQMAQEVKTYTQTLADESLLKDAHFFDWIQYEMMILE